MKIYVGNLPFSTNDAELSEVFSAHGEVAEATVILDRETGRSRGFGFVEMRDDNQAREAIQAMDGYDMGDRPLKVNEAKPRTDRGGGGGGGGGRQRGGW